MTADKRQKSARELAWASLIRCEKDSRFVNLEINATLKKNDLPEREKSLYTALVYASVEKEMLADTVLSPFLKKPVEKLDSEVRAALRLGCVQILFFDKLPDHAVCDSCVDIIKRSRCRSASGLVNAVLRGISADKDRILEKIENAPLSVKYSLPEWIITLWEKSYGKEKTLEILEGFSHKAPLVIHANTLKISPEALLGKIRESGILCEVHPSHPELIVVEGGAAEDIPGYDEGLFFVQGSASALAVKALKLCRGARVFDVCACPGGKSFAAALEMGNEGEIYSFDLHKSKLSLVESGAHRLGINIIRAGVHDARESFGDYENTADFVIADVPCSGLGVISKKPDIRMKKESDIERLPEIQAAILENASRLLKKGGRLLYSTCNLNRCENEDITDAFLKKHTDFVRDKGFPKTYFPTGDIEDGFFTDVIVKV